MTSGSVVLCARVCSLDRTYIQGEDRGIKRGRRRGSGRGGAQEKSYFNMADIAGESYTCGKIYNLYLSFNFSQKKGNHYNSKYNKKYATYLTCNRKRLNDFTFVINFFSGINAISQKTNFFLRSICSLV